MPHWKLVPLVNTSKTNHGDITNLLQSFFQGRWTPFLQDSSTCVLHWQQRYQPGQQHCPLFLMKFYFVGSFQHSNVPLHLKSTNWYLTHPSRRPWRMLKYCRNVGGLFCPLFLFSPSTFSFVTSSNSNQHFNKVERRESEPFPFTIYSKIYL